VRVFQPPAAHSRPPGGEIGWQEGDPAKPNRPWAGWAAVQYRQCAAVVAGAGSAGAGLGSPWAVGAGSAAAISGGAAASGSVSSQPEASSAVFRQVLELTPGVDRQNLSPALRGSRDRKMGAYGLLVMGSAPEEAFPKARHVERTLVYTSICALGRGGTILQ